MAFNKSFKYKEKNNTIKEIGSNLNTEIKIKYNKINYYKDKIVYFSLI